MAVRDCGVSLIEELSANFDGVIKLSKQLCFETSRMEAVIEKYEQSIIDVDVQKFVSELEDL